MFFGSSSNVIWEALGDIEISFCPPLWVSGSSCRCCSQINGCWMWFKHAELSNTSHPHNFLNLTFTPITVCICALSHTVLWYPLYMGSLQQITGNFDSSLFPRDTTKTVCLSLLPRLTPPTQPRSPLTTVVGFWCVVFSLYLETSSDPSFMAPRSLLHQKLGFAPASTAAIEIPIISCSAGTSLHWHFLKIAMTSKALHVHFLFLFYSLFTSPAFAVT